MPEKNSEIFAKCGEGAKFMPEDSWATVRKKIGRYSRLCAGCTFIIEQNAGTLSSHDSNRPCFLGRGKAPTG